MFVFNPWPARLVLNDADEPAGLQPLAPFSGGVAGPLGGILAGGLAVVVCVRQVEEAVHPYRDEGFIGLEGDAVHMHRVKLVGDRSVGTRGNEVADALDCAELVEEEGFLDGLFHILDVFSYAVVYAKIVPNYRFSSEFVKAHFQALTRT